jgi:hypothetical protein
MGIMEGPTNHLCDGRIAVAKSVIHPDQAGVAVRVMNMISEPQTLFGRMELGQCETVSVLMTLESPGDGTRGTLDPVNLLTWPTADAAME